jgi:hypothetical protein
MLVRPASLGAALSLLLAFSCGKAVDSGSPGEGSTGAERCFNGDDDDDDDLADCADPKCGEVARCVPVTDERGLEPGTLVDADQPCPEGFEDTETIIHQGVDLGECAGCDCEPGATTCTATAWYYADPADCSADEDLVLGTEIATPVTVDCPATPHIEGTIGGLRADVVAERSCAAGGFAEPGPPGWTHSLKFCRATQVGSGCAEGELCVNRMPQADAQCALAEGDVDCAGYGAGETDWYTGFGDEDSRICGACSCNAVGGGCDGVAVAIGSDWECGAGPGTVEDEDRNCTSVYSPPLQLTGTPDAPTGCVASATVTGDVSVVGQHTLCCVPD